MVTALREIRVTKARALAVAALLSRAGLHFRHRTVIFGRHHRRMKLAAAPDVVVDHYPAGRRSLRVAFVSDDGALQFRRDVYGRDALLQAVLDRERLRPGSQGAIDP